MHTNWQSGCVLDDTNVGFGRFCLCGDTKLAHLRSEAKIGSHCNKHIRFVERRMADSRCSGFLVQVILDHQVVILFIQLGCQPHLLGDPNRASGLLIELGHFPFLLVELDLLGMVCRPTIFANFGHASG